MVNFDGARQYEAITEARGLSFKVLVAGHRTKRMPKACHLNNVNSLHSEWKRGFRGDGGGWRRDTSMAARVGWWRVVIAIPLQFSGQLLPELHRNDLLA